VTLEYLALLGRAESALTAVPPAAAGCTHRRHRGPESRTPRRQRISPPSSRTSRLRRPAFAGARQRARSHRDHPRVALGFGCHVDSQAAENLLHEVYASSVFADLDQNQPASIFEHIGAAIQWILSHLFGLLGQGGSILLGLLVLAAIAALVIYRLRGVAGSRRARVADEPATAGDDPEREWTLGARRGTARRLSRSDSACLPLGTAGHRRPAGACRSRLDGRARCSRRCRPMRISSPWLPAAGLIRQGVVWREAVGADDWEVARAPAVRPSGASLAVPRGRSTIEPAAAPRRLPHLIAALCILAVIAISSAIPPNDQTNPSSRSAGSLGTLAPLHMVLGPGPRRRPDHRELSISPAVTWSSCYDPTVALTSSDVNAMMSFLRGGGDLILVVTPDSLADAAPLLGRLGVNTIRD